MKRLLPLVAGLSLVSCDSGTKHTEGTSSETQTALQALADNVRSLPESPGVSLSVPVGQGFAGRGLDIGSPCQGIGGFGQVEEYWDDRIISFMPDYKWHVARSERTVCSADSSLFIGFQSFWSRHDSLTWRIDHAVTAYPSGSGVWRFQQEASLSGGFRRIFQEKRVQEYYASFNPQTDSSEFLRSVLTDDRIEVDFMAGTMLNGRQDSILFLDLDTVGFRFPVLDLTRGRAKIGEFLRLPGKRCEVRDLEGRWIAPLNPASPSQPDSMGLMLLSDASDPDSFRLSLRIQTIEPAKIAPAKTALILTDSLERASGQLRGFAADSLPKSDRVLLLGAEGLAVGKRIQWNLARSGRTYDRVVLFRSYPTESGMSYWSNAVDEIKLDGSLVAP